MTKNQSKNYQEININQGNEKNISLGNNEKVNSSLNGATSRETQGFVNIKDFPELKTSSKRLDISSGSQSHVSNLQGNKSWLSVVSKGSGKNVREAFPALPISENNQRNVHALKKEKGHKKSQAIIDLESNNVVSEKETPAEEKKVQNLVNSKENKPRSTKNVPVQPQRNPHKKKRSEPIFINFQDVLMVHKPLRKPKKHNACKSRFQQDRRNKESLSGNYLDSSNPKRSRGKHREIKKEKLTKLKLAIIKERIVKQKIKEKEITEYFAGNECFHLIENTDFKSEIKVYLNKLNERKKQKSDSIQRTETLNPGKSEMIQEIKNTIDKKNTDKETKKVEQEETSKSVPESKDKKIPWTPAGGEIKFSSKFREYCDNVLAPDLNSAVSELISELVKLQDRLFARDPIKAKIKKRHVSGIREVKKYLILNKVKLVIIAPNLEKVQMEGGIYDSINELKSLANNQNVPYGFALDRYKLGRCTKKTVPVSAFAVLNYEGIEALFETTLCHLNEAKKRFLELKKPEVKKIEDAEDVKEKEDVNARVMSSLISVFREGLQLSNESSPSDLE